MSSTTSFKDTFQESVERGGVTYEYAISPGRFTTGNVTISLIDFSKADPIENEISPALKEAQAIVWSSIQGMISALKRGQRPSVEIQLVDLTETPKEDLFWIKASQISQTE